MEILQYFVQVIETGITVPVSGYDRFILDTDPDLLEIGIAGSVRLPDEQVHFPSPLGGRFDIQPAFYDTLIDIVFQFRTFLYQIPEDPMADNIRMHLLAMIVIVFCHDIVDHFIEGRFHDIIRLPGDFTRIFRSMKKAGFLA
jgi:hypothetical protein